MGRVVVVVVVVNEEVVGGGSTKAETIATQGARLCDDAPWESARKLREIHLVLLVEEIDKDPTWDRKERHLQQICRAYRTTV